ncbi:MAG: hypothetical protein JNK32_12915 [Anaerolineales bacterium]|nr:hypothetical protein [Anaerolineales bacterium]
MKKRNQLLIVSIVAIIMLACSALSQPSGSDQPSNPSDPSQGQQQPPANLLFSDDFSVSPSNEMEEYNADDGSAGTSNGVYVVRSTGDLWQWGRSNSSFDNVVVEVDAQMIQGPANNNSGFGVVCRLTEQADTSVDGYMLAISADGYYTIRSITASSMSPLVDWEYSSVVKQGSATNRIRATCSGSELKLEVNGELIASASTIAGGATSGSIAFAAISFETDEPIAEIHFDNLVVTKP